ncbi:20596_t:CDS:2, partial [Racocetra persica]
LQVQANQNLNISNNNILTFENKLDLLTKVIFKEQRKLNYSIELDPDKFLKLITQSNFQLNRFFDKIFNALSPKNRNQQTRENDKKSAVRFCYLFAEVQNKFANELKIEIGLYLLASGCIDIRSLLTGYHSLFLSTLNQCDLCKQIFLESNESNSIILICRHGYHLDCYKKIDNRCEYCIQYYKKRVFDNVKSFIETLENNKKEIIEDDNENNETNENNKNDENDEYFLSEQDSINIKYQNAILNVQNW